MKEYKPTVGDESKKHDSVEVDELFGIVQTALESGLKPADIPTAKILSRIGMAMTFTPPTRTNVIANIALGSLAAPIVGVTEADMVALVHEIFTKVSERPATKEEAAKYAAANAEYHAKEAAVKAESGGSAVDPQFGLLSPGSKLPN